MRDDYSWVEESRDQFFDYFSQVFEHFESPIDRYGSEYAPYHREDAEGVYLENLWAFKDDAARDDLLTAFTKVAANKGYPWLVVEAGTDLKSAGGWNHSVSLRVEGQAVSSIRDAFDKAILFMRDVAREYPAPYKGKSWEDYKDNHYVSEGMLWKDSTLHQMQMFDMIGKLNSKIKTRVVGEHRSKSISLPVVQFELPWNRTKVTVRDNFYDLAVSVDSKFPVKNTRNFGTLFKTGKVDGFFEGFPDDLVHKSYHDNRQQFSLHVGSYADLMILMGELINQDARPAVAPIYQPKLAR
ncbi:MAG: hypothetical protein H6867_07965 [Rhodospirillales bacterium]|nr:hypothetical protein [Rhodospirillales bacterium]MCB9995488.1 hypothetical protein [Rhodospirillales bacterium]